MARRRPETSDGTFASLNDWIDVQPRTRTYAQMAKLCGCSPSQLSEYRLGRRTPSAPMALRIHQRTGISLKGLVTGVPLTKRKRRKRPY